MIQFTCYGKPVPQGSMRAFIPKGWKRPVLTHDSKKLKPWRQQVAGCAIEAMAKPGIGKIIARPTAVRLTARFYFAKPKSAAKRVIFKTTQPDLSKLLRGLEDALTGIVYDDDAQIIQHEVSKAFGLPERTEVCVVEIPCREAHDLEGDNE